MSQSNWTVGALFLMFFIWITARGQLSTYLGLFGFGNQLPATKAAGLSGGGGVSTSGSSTNVPGSSTSGLSNLYYDPVTGLAGNLPSLTSVGGTNWDGSAPNDEPIDVSGPSPITGQ